MSLGDQFGIDSRHWLGRLLTGLWGTADVHSHFRARPLQRWLHQHAAQLAGASVLEVGCGKGMNLFELLKLAPEVHAANGFDMNQDEIKCAQRLQQHLGLGDRVQFHAQDCRYFSFAMPVDLVLLIDFLEHLPDPGAFLRELRPMMKTGAKVLVSVPTPLYPRVFGRRFHRDIGHLWDGFDLASLRQLLAQAGLSIDEVAYSTGPFANIVCAVYYRALAPLPSAVQALCGHFLSLLRWFDIGNGPRTSSSLFVVARSLDEQTKAA
jgi:2-polyprenyl-3-methyl-5-hydroxy-6-metoxy-1,4-benzoquinol methylase